VACASNLRQLGLAFANYVGENKGTYPPSWRPTNPTLTSSNISSTPTPVGPNQTFCSLLAKYLGVKGADGVSGTNLKIWQCTNDTLERSDFLSNLSNPVNGGPLSYMMPRSYHIDPYYGKLTYRNLTIADNPKGPNFSTTYVNVGMGQVWDGPGSYGMWIKTNMIKTPPKVILLAERSYSEQTQGTGWGYPFLLQNPSQQIWDSQSITAHGFPLLHSDANKRGGRTDDKSIQGRNVRFNYLFCDGHSELMCPRDTIHDQNAMVPGFGSGDFMWTIRPSDYK
jgi:prepilin-type processing-associated H-X9-DG protein